MDTLRIGSLCTGYGGLDSAVQAVFGGAVAWVSDIDPGANQIIAHHWPTTPNLGDLKTVDWSQVEPVDILCGGYPCQPFSDAGLRKGTEDERHIWPYIATALRVLRPRIAVFENVSGHLRRGFDTVLADLAGIGFDAQWCVASASEVGAPHQRKRLIILATAADAADLGHQWRRTARDGRPGLEDRRQSAADTERDLPGDDGELPAGRDALRLGVRDDAPRCGAAVADPAGVGHGDAGPAGIGGLPAAAVAGGASASADTDGRGRGAGEPDDGAGQSDVAWGRYEPAIRRWEQVLGRRVPRPTDDRGRLTPAFVEWLMGLPAGHVTAVPGLSRNAQLKALGNGVVPAQAEAAIRLLYARAITSSAAAAA